MKKYRKILAIMLILGDILFINANYFKTEEIAQNEIKLAYNILEVTVEETNAVYEELSKQQLIDKINSHLNSTISGKGELIVNHSLELGLDPYLATAIMLQETGCTWECSYLVKTCNNVGGQKGSGCGSYKYYNTLDEGIIGFLDNLYYNYYSVGLTTAELMNPKYAESTDWSMYVNNYIDKIKNS